MGVAAALLAACGGSQPPIGAPNAMPQTATIATHAERDGSWMLPEAKSEDLVYASNLRDNNVLVFSYPGLAQVGTLSGLASEPGGLCSDGRGDVFIVTQGDGHSIYQSFVYEFAHGGSSPIEIVTDPGFAYGCAIDATTGNLAVANLLAPSSNQGDLAVFSGAQGNPQTYSDPNFSGFAFCSYDNAGNLYADGGGPGTLIAELPRGANALTDIDLTQKINPYSIQWVRSQLVVAAFPPSAQGEESIYPVNVLGSTGNVGSPSLLWSKGNRRVIGGQFWVQGQNIVGLGFNSGHNELLEYWRYPNGGKPLKMIHVHPSPIYLGVTVSVAPSL